MSDRRAFVLGLGEGGLAGCAIGIVLGLVRVVLHQDLASGLLLVAAERVMVPALVGAVAGAALAASLTVVERAARTAGGLVLLVVAGAWTWGVTGPLRSLAVPVEYGSRPRLVAGALGLLVAAVLVVFGLRILGLIAPDGLRTVRTALAFAGLGAIALSAAAPPVASWVARARASDRPSVIVLCLDTMRADALGALGGRDLTPRLDALASEGTLFAQATSAAPWTLPAHVSLFTSLLPFDHHVRWSRQRVGPVQVMLAERFRDAGYRTAGFQGDAYVDGSYGFDQGFETYQAFHERPETGAQPIADAALAWIRAVRGRPFFVFVHTYLPHTPYTETGRADPADRGRLPATFGENEVHEVQGGRLVLDDRERRYVRALYDGDVARADAVMGGLLDTLRRDGTLDRTIVVVLSDHGEDLWDHDATRSPGHGHSLYQELVRVPLFVRAPHVIAAGRRIETPVSLLDIAPTLLELAGLPPDPAHQGRSLARTLRDGSEPSVEPVWSESVQYGPDRFAARGGRWKVIVTPEPEEALSGVTARARPLEVYDLAADPAETEDLADAPRAETIPLVRAVTARAAAKHRSANTTETHDDPSEELRETLRSLGYIE